MYRKYLDTEKFSLTNTSKTPDLAPVKDKKIFAIIIPVSEISPQCFSISRLCTESYFFSRKVHKWDPLQV